MERDLSHELETNTDDNEEFVMNTRKGEKRLFNRSYLYMYTFTLVWGGFIVGFCVSEINPMEDVLRAILHWDEDESDLYHNLITTFGVLGGFVGVILGGYVAFIGKRRCIIYNNILLWVACGVCMIKYTWTIMFGRFLFGVSSGLFCFLCPVYITEISPKEMTGALGSLYQLFSCLGVLVSTLLGFIIPQADDDGNQKSYDDMEGNETWRIIFLFPLLTSIFQLIMIFTTFIYDTPKYYVHQNKIDMCRKALCKIYLSQIDIDSEIADLEASEQAEANKKLGFCDLFGKNYRFAFFVGMFIAWLQQFSGQQALLSYSTKVYDKANMNGVLCTNLQNIINLVFCGISIFVMDRAGRKVLLIIGTSACMVCMIFAAVFADSETPSIAVYACFCYIAAFELSLGPILWLYLAEILPKLGVSYALGFNWLWTVFMVLMSPFMLKETWLKPAGTFALFAACNGSGVLFSIFCVKETKGLSKYEIFQRFSPKSQRAEISQTDDSAKLLLMTT